jgi:hypothetical protein
MSRPDEGGGSSVFSAISVGSLAAMETDLEGRSKTLQGQSTLKRRAGEFGIGTRSSRTSSTSASGSTTNCRCSVAA